MKRSQERNSVMKGGGKGHKRARANVRHKKGETVELRLAGKKRNGG